MHIPTKRSKRLVTPKRVLGSLILVALLSLGWQQMKLLSDETFVFFDDFLIASVERGDLIREVRAPGTLVPVDLSYLTATSSGRIKEILLEASDSVEVGTVIMRLDNPTLSQALDAAKLEVEVLRADYKALEQRLHQQLLTQRINVADFKARFDMAQLRQQAYQKLLSTGAVSEISFNEATLLVQQLKFALELEIERIQSIPSLQQAELAAAEAQTRKAVRHLKLQQKLADELEVKSPSKGVLQEITIKEGQQAVLGSQLARIAGQDNLKVELRVQESQAKDIVKGQSVLITAGGNSAKGIVKRIDPSVQQGVVKVDVYFNGDLLSGGRPDLRVEGAIKLQHLSNVLKIQRPVFTEEYSSRSLFVLDKNQTIAQRQQIEFGKSSIDTIEVLSLLNEGVQIVISDTGKYDEINQITFR